MSDRIYQAGYRSGKRQGRAEVKAEVQAIIDAWNDRNEYQRADIYGYWPEFSDLLDAAFTKEER